MLLKLTRPLWPGARVLSTSAPRASAEAAEVLKRVDYYKTLDEQGADSKLPEWNSARPFEDIPGPKPLPLVGNLWRFMPFVGDLHGAPFMEMFVGFQKKYGNVVLLKGIPGKRDCVFLFDPEDIEHMLRNSGTFPMRLGLEAFFHYRTVTRKDVFQGMGGLLTEQGEDWFKIRTMVNPIFMQPRMVQKHTPILDEIAGQLVDNMRHFAKLDANNQMPDDFVTVLYKWTLESVGILALNKRFGGLDLNAPGDSELRKLVNAVLNMVDHLYCFIRKSVDEAYLEPFDESLPDHELSVLQMLGKKDKRLAFAMVMDMVMAGTVNTGKTLGTILYFLAKHSDKQAKLREEILRVLPEKEMPVTNAALAKLPYLKAVIKESNRIAPVAIGILRTSTKDMVIGGYQIPKGTNLTVVSVYTANSSDHFKDPEKFLPERWLRETKDELSAKNANPFSSLPFGFGSRSCLGQRLVNLELEVVLTNIIRNLELSWERPDVRFVSRLLYGIDDPLKLTVKELA